MVCSLSDLEGLPLSPSAPPLVQEREHLVQGEPRGSPSAYSELSLAFSFTSQHGKITGANWKRFPEYLAFLKWLPWPRREGDLAIHMFHDKGRDIAPCWTSLHFPGQEKSNVESHFP